MSLLRSLSDGLRSLFRKERVEAELDEELNDFLEMAAEEKMKQGMSRKDALRAVRLERGSLEVTKEVIRSAGWEYFVETLWQDLRFGLRMLRKSPGFTAIAVLMLALGIGANTAIFSLINTLMLRRLPVSDPGKLVALLHRYPAPDEPHSNNFSAQAYQLIREHNDVFSGLIAASYDPVHVRGEDLETQIVNSGFVEGDFFSNLGLNAAIGRLIGAEDNQATQPSPVVVLSWSFWKSRFSLDPSILGKQLIVNGVTVTIVGVTRRNFSGLQIEARQDLWLPLALERIVAPSEPGHGSIALLGRLKPGVSLEQARAEIAVLYESTLDEEARTTGNPYIRKFKFEMVPAGAGLSSLRENFAKPLLALQGIVGLLLIITCANLASMLLARGAAREHEMAVRVSLGAGRLRLVRQVLTESLLLSMMGTLFGVLLAYLGTGLLVRVMLARRHPGSPLEFHVHADANVLLFTTAVTLFTALIFGLLPAWRALRPVVAPSLRQACRGSETPSRRFSGKCLVATQVALSVVLLSSAVQFIRHLSNLERLNLGFQRDRLLLVSLDPQDSGLEEEQLSRTYRELLVPLETIPGVRSVSLCRATPISGAGANRAVLVEGYESKAGEIRNVAENWVAPKYFETLGTPLLAGRDFDFGDQDHPRVAIINKTMARYYFGDRSPLGRTISFDKDDQNYQIVGVVGDSKLYDIRELTHRTVYFNMFQEPSPGSQFVLRTNIAPSAVVPEVIRTVRSRLKTVAVKHVTTMEDQVDETIVPERLIGLLSGWFGALGAALAAIGLYGLLAYTVARRTNEIGIRMALGATRANVTRIVLRDALGMVCAGLLIGAPLAFWGRRIGASLIPDMPAASVAPIIFGALGMITLALLAAYLPVRRAVGIDPMVALRYE
jgi:predicted permease